MDKREPYEYQFLALLAKAIKKQQELKNQRIKKTTPNMLDEGKKEQTYF
ncbi:hypothetical protein [Paenibacillus alvei]|uniref:Uncharacterized protein n=1 Tax=Paenibacillus alvei TaxID=44250 RepID=A0A383RC32_PAEAL|nr:hypothetical protein [Paenibacillus alvei]SYX84657.1 protein of unknown function [Paenibacillus alvei]